MPFELVLDDRNAYVYIRAGCLSAQHPYLHADAIAVLEAQAAALPFQLSTHDACKSCGKPCMRHTRAHTDVLALTCGFQHAHEAVMKLPLSEMTKVGTVLFNCAEKLVVATWVCPAL